MNIEALIQRGVQRNMKALGIKPFDPAERLATISPADRNTMERALRQWYGQQGIDPLQSEGMVQKDLGALWR